MDLSEQLKLALGDSYTIERELAGGGMSRVFVADEARLGRKVVVKVLAPELAAGLSAERFAREIRVAASLQQANIVPVLAAGEADGLSYFMMPFVEGESLRAHMARSGTLSITEVVRILGDVARALTYAHAHGVVHRDIKPDNVLLSGGTAVVTDFGIAKALAAAKQGDGSDDESPTATLTQIGTSIGTPAYMAPEQAAGDPDVDHRADIYAFGCMAYELLAGRPPFHGRTPQRILAAHMSETPQPVGELRADTPVMLGDLVMRCLAKTPAARPQTTADIARTLDNVVSSGNLPSMPAALLEGPRMLRRALALYALAFVVVAIVTKGAILVLGLPDWVFPGVLIVMGLGLPAILFTGYVHRVTYRTLTATPFVTPRGGTSPPGRMATLAVKASPYVSWQRTAAGSAVALGVFAILVGVFMAMRAFGVGPVASLFASGALREQEPILVADFETSVADSALSRPLAQALRTSLGQSRRLRLLPTSRLTQALKRMQKPITARLEGGLARELAQREGLRAVVLGTITPLGNGYIVTARLVAPSSGDELASAERSVDNARDLIPAIDRIGRALRGRVGESLKGVRRDPPLWRVTTTSLEALKKYDEGWRAYNIEADFPKAVRALEQAVALDSTFASAYRLLSQAINNVGNDPERRQTTLETAYRLRDRLAEGERLSVEGTYFNASRHADRARAVEAWEAAAKLGPIVLLNLGENYLMRREFAKAESTFVRGTRATGTPQQYRNLISAQLSQGKIAEAESTLSSLQARYPQDQRVPEGKAAIAYARGLIDSVAAVYQMDITANGDQVRLRGRAGLANVSILRGRLSEAARHRAAAQSINQARGVTRNPLLDALDEARIELLISNRPRRAAELLDAALRRTPVSSTATRSLYYDLASLYAELGEPEKANTLLKQAAAALDSAEQRLSMPSKHRARGSIALAESRPLDAVREFRSADRLPDGPVDACAICADVEIGDAFDGANLPDSAIAVFEHFIATPSEGRLPIDALHLALISKRLGELYEAKGDRAKAMVNYRRFVDLWKSADPELQPKVAEVRRRLLRLADVERR